MADYDSILLIIKAIIGVIVVIATTFFVLRPLFKSMTTIDHRMKASHSGMQHRIQDEELEIPTSRATDVSNQMIIKKALEDPIKTTQLVRNWLRDKK